MRTETITCDACGKELAESGRTNPRGLDPIFARIGMGSEQDVPNFVAMVPPSSNLPYRAADQPLEVCSWECASKLLKQFISARDASEQQKKDKANS